MAAGTEELTFAALPPIRGRGFARTWWGRAWLKALEDTVLDEALLLRGRRHARAGAVSVRPGRITAVARGRDGTAYRADVLVQQLDAADWERLLDAIADRAGHIAALLDRDMPAELAEDAAAAGVQLLPGIGDLQPECACEEWDHCEHTAALSYHVARLLDADPFVLLLMRGRGERELLAELQERSAARGSAAAGGGAAEPPAGVPADEAYAAAGSLPPLPAPPEPVAEPGAPPALGGAADPAPGVDVQALEFLVADTAARARRLLAEALAPGHAEAPLPTDLTPDQDAVRMAVTAAALGAAGGQGTTAGSGATRAAGSGTGSAAGAASSGATGATGPRETHAAGSAASGAARSRTGAGEPPGTGHSTGSGTGSAAASGAPAASAAAPRVVARLAHGTGRSRAALDRAVRAWRQGGPAGLAVLEEAWTPAPEVRARAEDRLAAAWEPDARPRLRAARNRWTAVGTDAQLRYGRDGRWWPYRKEGAAWAPAGPPDHDPAAALAALLEDAWATAPRGPATARPPG